MNRIKQFIRRFNLDGAEAGLAARELSAGLSPEQVLANLIAIGSRPPLRVLAVEMLAESRWGATVAQALDQRGVSVSRKELLQGRMAYQLIEKNYPPDLFIKD